jgi:hypothetical protein
MNLNRYHLSKLLKALKGLKVKPIRIHHKILTILMKNLIQVRKVN